MSTLYLAARPEDLGPVQRLLAECGLPTQDVEPHLGNVLLAWSGDELAGVVGLELHGEVGLLRSLGVAPAYRKQGIGRELCDKILQHARAQGVHTLYLLTTSAAGYFRRLGYRSVERNVAPPGIRETQQFRTLCPDTAEILAKTIAADARSAG